MALKEITVDGQPILVEVTDLPVEGGAGGAGGAGAGGFEYTKAPGDMGERISALVGVLTAPIQRALADAQAAEWTLEVTMGFKGETGASLYRQGRGQRGREGDRQVDQGILARWRGVPDRQPLAGP